MQLEEFQGHMFRDWVHYTENFKDIDSRGHIFSSLKTNLNENIQLEDKYDFRVHFPFLCCKKIEKDLPLKFDLNINIYDTFDPEETNGVSTNPM